MNLFEDIPQELPEELLTPLLNQKRVRIERIVSQGHCSDSDFWYDQVEHEWLSVLQGSAEFEYEDGSVKTLSTGDCAFIPAHLKHRVKSTSLEPKCIWLAVFFAEDANE
jgi:cupin 2 domain-containing protein